VSFIYVTTKECVLILFSWICFLSKTCNGQIWHMDIGVVQCMVQPRVKQYTEISYLGHLIHKFVKAAVSTVGVSAM
jgi:hypothetical protein